MDFSIILQSPEVRQIVQENSLERAFHDALFPKLMFRSEAEPDKFPGNIGDTVIMSAPGLMDADLQPLTPGQDPLPADYGKEQWEATVQQWAGSIDTHMPTSAVAAVDLFLRNGTQLGLKAAMSLNRLVRERMYNAALSGQTVTDAAALAAATTISVRRLNGFTKARRPDLPAGSPVRFAAVSTNNPLPITITLATGALHSASVTAFTPATTGDEIGPGTLTFTPALPSGVNDRAAVLALDKSVLVRVGGGDTIDSVGNNDLFKLKDVRTALARFRNSNVPEFDDGKYHCHMSATSEQQLFGDPEWQRLNTGKVDGYPYEQFAIGVVLGTVFVRDSECPVRETVKTVGNDGVTYTTQDPFAGELFTNESATTGVRVHRPLFVAQASIFEYYLELMQLITEAGVQGKVGSARITNNGIEVMAERIQMIIRQPQNRLQDMVSTSYKFIGDWPVRTDVLTGDGARLKRLVAVEHGE